MKSPEHDQGRLPAQPVVRYAPVGEIKIYMIQESELETLANGSSDSLFLSFSLALLPTALTLLVALITTKIESLYTFTAFVAVCAICFISGFSFLALWWRSRATKQRLVEEIKRRMPPPVGIQETST